MSKLKTIVCRTCKKSKATASNYYKSNKQEYKAYDGNCPICKLCLRTLSIDGTLNEITPDSFKEVLYHLDSPYIKTVFISVMSNADTTNANFIGRYRRALNLNVEYKKANYADSVMFKLLEEGRQNAKTESKVISAVEIDDEMKLFWGMGLEDNAYIYMQTMYNRFTKHEKKMDHKKESDYKTLCIYEWQKSTIQYNIDEVPKLEKLQRMIDTLSSSLGILARQRLEEESNEKFTIGLITRYHEDIKKDPIKRWVEDLGNVDLMRNMLEIHYKGGIMHSLKIPNPDIEQYQAELDKYTVHMTQDDEDGDE